MRRSSPPTALPAASAASATVEAATALPAASAASITVEAATASAAATRGARLGQIAERLALGHRRGVASAGAFLLLATEVRRHVGHSGDGVAAFRGRKGVLERTERFRTVQVSKLLK